MYLFLLWDIYFCMESVSLINTYINFPQIFKFNAIPVKNSISILFWEVDGNWQSDLNFSFMFWVKYFLGAQKNLLGKNK